MTASQQKAFRSRLLLEISKIEAQLQTVRDRRTWWILHESLDGLKRQYRLECIAAEMAVAR